MKTFVYGFGNICSCYPTRGFLILSNLWYALSHEDDKLILNIDKLASQLENFLKLVKKYAFLDLHIFYIKMLLKNY